MWSILLPGPVATKSLLVLHARGHVDVHDLHFPARGHVNIHGPGSCLWFVFLLEAMLMFDAILVSLVWGPS